MTGALAVPPAGVAHEGAASQSMVALQTEKARLGALDLEMQLAEARATSCRQAAVVAAGLAVRNAVCAALDALPEVLRRALGEPSRVPADETLVHYRLSDAVHETVDRLGRLAESASVPALPEFGAHFRRGCRPRSLLTVSEWADRHRWLASGTNAPGRWRTSLTPYLRDIMDDLSEHSPVRTVVFCKASGIGGTEAMYNWLGYIMGHLGNRDVLHVSSTLELRDRSFNPRLSKMMRETPALAAISQTASRHSANRSDVLEYSPVSRLIKAGANSPDSLSSDHVPYVALDEVDRYPWDVGGEGDPLTLISNRQRSFSRAKTFLLSTPTRADHSRIWDAYLEGDQRRLHVPCPHCQGYHEMTRDRLRWRCAHPVGGHAAAAVESMQSLQAPDGAPAGNPGGQRAVLSAWFVCPSCGAEIDERAKPWMLEHCRWVASVARPSVPGTRSYQMSAAYSPVGLGLTWRDLAQRLVNAQTDTTKVRAIINTDWGEVYKEPAEAIEGGMLLLRRESYTRASLEAAGKIWRVTAWTDVQKDRLEMSVVGWGAGEEAWLFDHVILSGDTAREDVWHDLAAAEEESCVDFAGVDAGYNTTLVLAHVARGAWRRATKGMPGTWRAIIEDAGRRAQRLRRQRRAGPMVEPMGVDQAKSIILARLRQAKPGPGYIHFPVSEAFDQEYFDQLGAEELRRRVRNGRVLVEWVQVRPRNEALDCLVGNLAICRLAGPLLNLPHKRRASPAPNPLGDAPPAAASPAPESPPAFDLQAAIASAARVLRGRR